MAARTQFRLEGKTRDSYLELVLAFPLASIRSEAHLVEAQRVMDGLPLKVVLRKDVLRGQSPGIVREEVWAHLLAYNVVRRLMAQVAAGVGVRAGELFDHRGRVADR